MAKKQSVSSRRAKPIQVSAESIWSKPLTKRQKAVVNGVAKRQARGAASQIDYSDIPALSTKQLAQFKRTPKKLVAVRLDAEVFEWLQGFGAGYSTRINDVLRAVMVQQR
ncbi:MAG: BrnA antitoxin family protein [Bryobacteraceae bacterium]